MAADLFSRLMDDPTAMADACYDDGFRMEPKQIQALHEHGVRERFSKLRPQLPVLDKLAEEQGIQQIRELNDIAPVLFPHTIYKSYPLSYFERNRFDRLTKWLDGLTTVDLSRLDASGIESIDDWLDLLDAETPLMVAHTSGTSGKLSFTPRTKEQWRQTIATTSNIVRDWYGPNSGPDMRKDHRPVISPNYRFGAAATQRGASWQAGMFAGGAENTLYLYHDARFSADVASLAGRLRAAEARGEQGALNISPVLLARREQLIELERRRPADLQHFFDAAQSRFGGQDVFISALWALLYDWAAEGLKRGYKNIFGPGSVLFTGGGKKGADMPDNWLDIVREFLGFDRFYEMYGTSELMGLSMRCECGNYHFPPTLVPFLLSPETGEPLPRLDGVTGRLAMFDMVPDSYWAGMVTGDEITWGGWQAPCACGRTGPFVVPPIRRYSEIEGGDDKIICAGAPEAHDQALAFLAQISE